MSRCRAAYRYAEGGPSWTRECSPCADRARHRRVSGRRGGPGGRGRPVGDAPSVFFPGCSLVNYAPALVSVLTDYLEGTGIAQGVSLLCCGKILDFEEGGAGRRDTVDGKMREAFLRAGVRRVVAACPNCAAALRRALDAPGAPDVEVVPLPRALADPAAASMRGPSALAQRAFLRRRRAPLGARFLSRPGRVRVRRWHARAPAHLGAYRGEPKARLALLQIDGPGRPGRFERRFRRTPRRADEAASLRRGCARVRLRGLRGLAHDGSGGAPGRPLPGVSLRVPHGLARPGHPMALRFLLEGARRVRGRGRPRLYRSGKRCGGRAMSAVERSVRATASTAATTARSSRRWRTGG